MEAHGHSAQNLPLLKCHFIRHNRLVTSQPAQVFTPPPKPHLQLTGRCTRYVGRALGSLRAAGRKPGAQGAEPRRVAQTRCPRRSRVWRQRGATRRRPRGFPPRHRRSGRQRASPRDPNLPQNGRRGAASTGPEPPSGQLAPLEATPFGNWRRHKHARAPGVRRPHFRPRSRHAPAPRELRPYFRSCSRHASRPPAPASVSARIPGTPRALRLRPCGAATPLPPHSWHAPLLRAPGSAPLFLPTLPARPAPSGPGLRTSLATGTRDPASAPSSQHTPRPPAPPFRPHRKAAKMAP